MGHPAKAWLREFDAERVTWGESWSADGVAFRRFRMVTGTCEGADVSTYGVAGWPEGATGPLPGLLHVHGGGQTADEAEVRFGVSHGYAVVTFDWTGDKDGRDHERVAWHPEGWSVGGWLEAMERTGSPQTRYFHGLQAGYQCLGLLRSLEVVDAERTGAYGISWGGFLCWLLNSVDNRLRAVTAIYGTGGLHWPGHIWNREWAQVKPSTRALWMQIAEPRGHLPYQHAPLVFLNGTNDFFGGMNVAGELLPAMPVSWRASYSPNSNHHVSGGGLRLMLAWFDHYLRGGPAVLPTPSVQVAKDDAGWAVLTDTGEGTTTDLWLSTGHEPHVSRCWQQRSESEVLADGRRRFALDVGGTVWLFVRRVDAAGVEACSEPVCVELPEVAPKAPLTALFEGDQLMGLGLQMSTQPRDGSNVEDAFALGPDGLSGQVDEVMGGVLLWTPGLPEGRAPEGTSALEVRVTGTARLQVNVGPLEAVTEVAEDGPVRLALGDFTAKDQQLESFQEVKGLMLKLVPRAGCRPALQQVRWL